MTKQPKYPKKFRMKLEKIAEARDERANQTQVEDDRRVVDTLWHEFLPPKSVHFMHAVGNDEQTRLTVNYQLFPGFRHDYVHTTPPWHPSDVETPAPA